MKKPASVALAVRVASLSLFLSGLGLFVLMLLYGLRGVAEVSLPIVGLLFVAVGVILFMWGVVTESDSQAHAVATAISRIPDLAFHSFFTSIFIANLVLLCLFLLFPERLALSAEDQKDMQVLGCIGAAGLLGGFIRQSQTNLKPRYMRRHNSSSMLTSPYVRFWTVLFALFLPFSQRWSSFCCCGQVS